MESEQKNVREISEIVMGMNQNLETVCPYWRPPEVERRLRAGDTLGGPGCSYREDGPVMKIGNGTLKDYYEKDQVRREGQVRREV